ncbi:MAG: exodeoxyribonuclease VII small subunit [Pirellulales bacterium]
MTDPKDAPAVPDPAGFEEALSRLEAIVQALEEGQVPLADALARYEEGIKLLKACYQTLEHAERRIEVLNRVDQQGRADSEPFDDSALSLDQKAQSRSRRRSRAADSSSASEQNEIDESGRLF